MSVETSQRPDLAQERAEAGVRELATQARVAARQLRSATTAEKNAALHAVADHLVASTEEIVAANAVDVDRESEAGMSPGLVDRLRLDADRVAGIAAAVRELATLPDPVGEVVRGQTLPNGLTVRQVRVPMGVVGMIYEARPNVTVDAAGLALKSGNAVLLRGGSAAASSNAVIVGVLREALQSVGLPADAVATIDEYGRAGARALMRARGLVDLLVPRGGTGLIQTVVTESLVPVIETGVGNCHLFIDNGADVADALAILINAKTQRVGVCNTVETLLVHAGIAADFLPSALEALATAEVHIHGDATVQQYLPPSASFTPATEEDWQTEYLSKDLAIRVVPGLDAALEHIRTYSSGHTEAICTQNVTSMQRFTTELDSAALMVNASTRFTDGSQLGLGAELGISTQKLHARGPMGLAELTTTTWIVQGSGHIRP